MNTITFKPIGVFQTPFTRLEDMPIQPVAAKGVGGRIEIDPAFEEGLRDLDGFSHVFVIYHMHRAAEPRLLVTPFLDDKPHGVFATRAPLRPNPIGLSILELKGIEGLTLHLRNVDVLDGTPVLDIKPYLPDFDVWEVKRIGWYEGRSDRVAQTRSDGRFGS